MQRLPKIENGLRLVDEHDDVLFKSERGGLSVRRGTSVPRFSGSKPILVEGDNLEELAEWLTQIDDFDEDDVDLTPELSHFMEYNQTYKRVAGVAVAYSQDQPSDFDSALESLLSTIDTETELPTDLEGIVEESQKLVEQMGGALKAIEGMVHYSTSDMLNLSATHAGLIVPEGYNVALMATHTKGQKELLVAEATPSCRIPAERAREFGAWILGGRSELQKKKSVWG